MNDPEDKKGKPPESKPGTTPGGGKPEVAPDVSRPPRGPIKEIAPDVEKGRPIKEVAPDVYGSSYRHGGHAVPLYAATIHSAIAEGNLQRMQQLEKQAEQQLAQYGDLRSALEILKVEIAKLQHKHKS
jgi:hypothetical protein